MGSVGEGREQALIRPDRGGDGGRGEDPGLGFGRIHRVLILTHRFDPAPFGPVAGQGLATGRVLPQTVAVVGVGLDQVGQEILIQQSPGSCTCI